MIKIDLSPLSKSVIKRNNQRGNVFFPTGGIFTKKTRDKIRSIFLKAALFKNPGTTAFRCQVLASVYFFAALWDFIPGEKKTMHYQWVQIFSFFFAISFIIIQCVN